MARVVLMSDNHRDFNFKSILENEKYDVAIHLGDSEMDRKGISHYFDHYVAGNNDFWQKDEDIVYIGGLSIGLLHGHSRWITPHTFKEQLYEFAVENDLKYVFFGHTHIQTDIVYKGVRMINPGSTYYPRDGRKPSYMILEIVDGEIIKEEVKYVFI